MTRFLDCFVTYWRQAYWYRLIGHECFHVRWSVPQGRVTQGNERGYKLPSVHVPSEQTCFCNLERFFSLHFFLLPILDYFVFSCEVEDIFSISVKSYLGILMRIMLILWIAFYRIVIFTVLSLPIHGYGGSFYFLISSSIPFFNVLRFLLSESFICSVRSYPKYFMLSEALWKVLFLWFLSQSVCYLYMCRLLIFLCWFWVQPLCLKCLSAGGVLLVEFLGPCKYTIISSASKDTLTSSFPVRVPSICFSCLIALNAC